MPDYGDYDVPAFYEPRNPPLAPRSLLSGRLGAAPIASRQVQAAARPIPIPRQTGNPSLGAQVGVKEGPSLPGRVVAPNVAVGGEKAYAFSYTTYPRTAAAFTVAPAQNIVTSAISWFIRSEEELAGRYAQIVDVVTGGVSIYLASAPASRELVYGGPAGMGWKYTRPLHGVLVPKGQPIAISVRNLTDSWIEFSGEVKGNMVTTPARAPVLR